MKRIIPLRVNARSYEVAVEPNRRLLDLIRLDLGLTGTKCGCGIGDCGACTVLLDGVATFSCLVLAVQAAGSDIVTVEGLAQGSRLHPLQQAFVELGAIQCGFCTPGMLMSSLALLERNPEPTEAQVRRALSGNLCRCTGYQKIVEAVLEAAERLRTGGPP